MQFIKNKKNHRAKYLLASSILILNGNNSCLTMLPASNQQGLRSGTLYRAIRANSEDVTIIEKTLNELAASCDELKHCCQKVKEELSKKNQPLSTTAVNSTYSQQQGGNGYESGYETEDEERSIYDTVPSENEEPIYEEIGKGTASQQPNNTGTNIPSTWL